MRAKEDDMPEEIFDSEYGTGFRFSDGNVVYVGYNVWMTDSTRTTIWITDKEGLQHEH